jgi:hypothetical protein
VAWACLQPCRQTAACACLTCGEFECRASEAVCVSVAAACSDARCMCLNARALRHCRVTVTRDKEHSTIIFEGPSDTPLLRLGWNKQDPRYIATLLADSPKVRVCVSLATTLHTHSVLSPWLSLCPGATRTSAAAASQHATNHPACLLPLLVPPPPPPHRHPRPCPAAQVIILDIRYPTVPITQLTRHHACANALAWAPHSASHLCTAGDDCQVRVRVRVAQLSIGLRTCDA